MATFEVVDLTKGSIVTRGGEYLDKAAIGSIDTAELAQQLDLLRSDLSSVLDRSRAGIGLKSIVVKLTVGAEGKVAFIARGSIEASIEVTFSSVDSAG